MRRRILACSAIALLVGGAVIGWWRPEATDILAFCWRAGAIMAAAWLAFDDIQRLPNWLLMMLPVLLIVLVRWPRLLLLMIPALILLAVVRRLLWPADGANRGR
jgi:hypothetical protein